MSLSQAGRGKKKKALRIKAGRDRPREVHSELHNLILRLLNSPGDQLGKVREIVHLIKEEIGITAVGLRLKEGDDFPYFEETGFPSHFISLEKYLCEYDSSGEVLRDSAGGAFLECMCGNIIHGRYDPSLPHFTRGGSFWTNSTSDLLASSTEEELLSRTRNRCNGEGYESVALIPLRTRKGNLGLLQLNDMRSDMFSLPFIEALEGIAETIGIVLERHFTEEELLRRSSALEERVKELNCLYGIYRLVQEPDLSFQTFLQEVLELLPASWQYPEAAGARIVLWENDFQTSNFRNTPWSQRAAIRVQGEEAGFVEVCYLEEHPLSDEGPFLHEERNLIDAVAVQLERIAERRRADLSLLESEEKYRQLFSTTGIPVFLAYRDSLKIIEANAAAERTYGYTRDEFLHRRLTDMFMEADQAEGLLCDAALGQGGAVTPHYHRKKDGSPFPVEISGGMLGHKGITVLFAIISDLTERVQAEAKGIEYQEQLRKLALELSSSEERERRELAAVLHDEIGQLLAMCKLNLEQSNPGDNQDNRVRNARAARELLDRAISRSRDLTRELSSQALYKLGLEAALEELCTLLGRNHDTVFTVSKGNRPLPVIQDSLGMLFQAVRELLVNVVKHAKAQHARVSLDTEGELLRIVVTDDGKGFDEPIDEHSPPSSGRFGLFNIRERLRHVGGSITIWSSSRKGSRVTILVPPEIPPVDRQQ